MTQELNNVETEQMSRTYTQEHRRESKQRCMLAPFLRYLCVSINVTNSRSDIWTARTRQKELIKQRLFTHIQLINILIDECNT